MEVPKLGVKLKLQLLAYATATATRDLSHIYDSHHGSWQHWILLSFFVVVVVVVIVAISWAAPQHMEVPRLGVESELLLPAYARATTTPDLNCVCDLHHSSWQRQILNPLSKARDQPTTSWFLIRFINH